MKIKNLNYELTKEQLNLFLRNGWELKTQTKNNIQTKYLFNSLGATIHLRRKERDFPISLAFENEKVQHFLNFDDLFEYLKIDTNKWFPDLDIDIENENSLQERYDELEKKYLLLLEKQNEILENHSLFLEKFVSILSKKLKGKKNGKQIKTK